VPLRLLAGLHYLVLDGRASWESVPEALDAEADFLRRFVAEQGVQTNEVQRSWMLLPLFLRAAQRTGAETLDLIELGPSAGLNLVWDRYGYRYEAGGWSRRGATLVLTGEEQGRVPGEVLLQTPRVGRRVGIDRSPIDVTSDDGARLLASFVWADQSDRLDLLRRAIEALRVDAPELRRGDVVDLLPEALADRREDALTIVFQTAVLAYVDERGRARIRAALEEAGAAGPLVFVSTGRAREDRRGWGLRISYWPGGEREFAGHGDFHGAWLDWELGSP
jgi:hypothetical protein